MAEPIVNIIDPTTFSQQTILPQDEVLIQNQVIDSPFDLTKDQVELYYYDYSQNLISANYNFLDWKSYNDPSLIAKNKLQDLYVDPAIDGVVAEVPNGIVYLIYNFVSNKLNSSDQQRFYIDTISADRTEITLKTNNLSNEELETLTNTFVAELQLTPYFQEFYLNFGDNNSIIGLNIRVNKNNPVYSLDIKLYEPLPSSTVLKDTCWVQTQIADPIGYSVEYNTRIILVDQQIPLRGPNFNLKAVGETSVATNLENLTTLKQTNLTGSRAQIDSILNEKGVVLNIDYTDFNNFVHFSSAETRLENFYTKVSLIEDYQNSINQITASNTTETRDTSITILQNEINSLVENFDGYEYFLYYSSESKAWPKTNSTAPYVLATTGSSLVLNWYGNSVEGAPYFGGERYSASIYDNQNQDNLVYTIPQFIVNDSTNLPYITFVEMVGQHFDTLYTYTQAISQKYNADNRLNYGVSKDLVADVLRSFGIKIYENNFSPADLYSALLGITPAGTTLLLPDITTTYPVTGSGLEYIQTIISASSDVIGLDDLNKSIYKRLYHNLPLLVKKKGTLAGLRLLVNSYGIPDTILRINEFGGKDRASNTWDQWQQQYDYSYDTKGVGFISSSFTLNSNWNATGNKPSAVEFRFKTPGLPSSNYSSQSLWSTDNGATLILKYTGSGLTSGSYSGSTVNPYYEYGLLEFYPSSSNLTATASIYLPFFNGDWWSILINKSSSTDFTVYVKNKLYNGDTGCILGYQASSSINLANPWVNATNSYFGTSTFNAKTFSGSLQEIRYYTQPISENTFDAYVMNPQSIEQSEYLAFRGALGGELYTASISIHPKISGEQVTTSSFVGNSTYFITSSGEFTSNVETTFYDQVASGVKNAISNKIRVGENTGYGTVLSSQISIQQHTSSTSFTPNVNYLEVGFSPQNEINEDINSQLGYFNIGEYIGDPRFISESNYRYPALDTLSLDYFKKYSSSYNFNDYFRLIKFFDNSLFKLIKDFVPARTAAATGAIVKQHLLERNRQRPAQVNYTQPEYTGSVTSLARDYQTGSIEVFTGGAGGSVNVLTNISQSWTSSILTKAGLVTEIESSQYEFFNGEYSGSSIDVINNKLQDNPLLGAAYRVGVPDLQNLTATRTTTFSAACVELVGGNYKTSTSSAVFPFNQSTLPSTYYNTGTYSYTPLYPVQVDMQVSISASFLQANAADAEAFSVDLYLVETSQGVRNVLGLQSFNTGSDAGPFPSANPFKFSKTFSNVYIKSGSTYTVEYIGGCNASGDDVGSFQFAVAGTSWLVSVDNLAAQSTYYLDPTVYTQQNFPGDINDFSDYNSLLNNVYSNRVSNVYYDVDYSQNALNPINFTTIISQSAIYAQVQDSNYVSASAWTRGRYEGTKLTSATYNTYTDGDISYGQTAVIDTYKAYFLYFSKITLAQAGVDGIWSGGNVKGVALIGPDGTSISLDKTNANLGLIESLFPSASQVTLVSPTPALGTDLGPNNLSVIIGGGVDTGIIVPGTYTPDETNILIRSSAGDAVVFVDSPGYLIPSGYSPEYLKKVVDTAAQAGFPIN
jgi:hypothetical protein